MRERGVAKTPSLVGIVDCCVIHHELTFRFLLPRKPMLRTAQHYNMLRFAAHCTTLAPVVASTTIVPIMCGCKEQKYW